MRPATAAAVGPPSQGTYAGLLVAAPHIRPLRPCRSPSPGYRTKCAALCCRTTPNDSRFAGAKPATWTLPSTTSLQPQLQYFPLCCNSSTGIPYPLQLVHRSS